jgi:hypothetical protein
LEKKSIELRAKSVELRANSKKKSKRRLLLSALGSQLDASF